MRLALILAICSFPTFAAAASPSVNLSCTPPASGANSFNFYRSTVKGGPYAVIGKSGTCAYVDATVAYSTTYFYVATSVNTLTCPSGSNCESGYSAEVQCVVGQNPIPNPPTGLTAGSVIAGGVPLQWQAPTNENVRAYRVYRKATDRPNWLQVAGGVVATNYTDRPTRSATFDYQIRANVLRGSALVLSNPSNLVEVVFTR